MTSINHLKKIAWSIGIFGGVTSFVLMNSVPYILSQRICETDQYKQAIQLLRDHPEATKYLGEPIKDKRVLTTLEENYGQNEEKMWIRVPVEGPKDVGLLYYDFFLKDNTDGKVQLSSVELQLQKLKGYKLLLKKPD